jgi:hypothetical protein
MINMSRIIDPAVINAMVEQKILVIKLREDLQKVNQEISKIESEHADLYGDQNYLRTCLKEAEDKLRQNAVEVYNVYGDKKPIAGVGIREYSVLVYDEQAAEAWARMHNIAMTLDKARFEKFAKSMLEAGLTDLNINSVASIVIRPQATIAKEL